MEKFSIAGRVASGTLDVDRAALARAVRQMKDGPVVVSIGPLKSKRSVSQNAYWWAVPVPMLAEYCGETPNRMHYQLLGECFGYTEGLGGKPVPVKPSSSDLSVEEFKQLIDWVLTWAPTELGVVIPAPDEYEAA